VVAVAPGGPTDLLARAVGKKLTETWGQTISVENRPGAGQVIGTAAVARAAPDGYTLLMTTNVFPVNTFLFPKLPYDPQRDFDPVSLLVETSLVLVVHPSVPAQNLQEFIAYAKAHPGKLNFGSSGPSSSLRFAGELLKSQAGIDMIHVPFNGTGPLTTALISGTVEVAIASLQAPKTHIDSGRLRALATTGAQRSPIMPDLPTMAEAGLTGYQAGSWFGLLAPAGTPAAVIRKIQADVAATLGTPEVAQAIRSLDGVAIGNTPAQFAAYIEAESRKWERIIQEHGIKAD
jgi:tripartite-type tricarboxylate transporter receptor subunit TctC